MKRKARKGTRGQSTVEYLLLVAFGAFFSIQVMKFFNGVFREGLGRLEGNVSSQMETGQGFGSSGQ